MKKYINLLFILSFVGIYSCIDDEKDPPEIIYTIEGNHANIEGKITDGNGNPLSGVEIISDGQSATSDGDGYYRLTELSGGEKSIKFSKSGFVTTHKITTAKEWKFSRADASLHSVGYTNSFNSVDGLEIQQTDFSVSLPQNGFVDSDGNPFSGQVTVNVTPFLTTDPTFLDAFPGKFEGVRTNNETVPIESFGFIDIELFDKDGNSLNLAAGNSAEIKLKAPANAEPETPIWYFDAETMTWIEEGTATLINGFYVADVTHFTKWNFDYPMLNSALSGRVVDQNGNALSNAYVEQRGIDYAGFYSGYTDSLGQFEILAKADGQAQIMASYEFYYPSEFRTETAGAEFETRIIGDVIIQIDDDNTLAPVVLENRVTLTDKDGSKSYIVYARYFLYFYKEIDGYRNRHFIRGSFFGNEKREGYELLIDGKVVETVEWENNIIRFYTPKWINSEGLIQVRRGDKISNPMRYIEKDLPTYDETGQES